MNIYLTIPEKIQVQKLSRDFFRKAKNVFRCTENIDYGPWDPGKTGKEGLNEKEINLSIALKLCEFLEQSGADTVLTRKEDLALGADKSEDMKKRIDTANSCGADIMISIHQNAFKNEKVKGAQVFYFSEDSEGRLLAECIQKSLTDILDEKNKRTAKSNSDYYILKYSNMPAIIIECGFLSNSTEERLLNKEEYQLKTAWAIYDGICDYFEIKAKENIV